MASSRAAWLASGDPAAPTVSRPVSTMDCPRTTDVLSTVSALWVMRARTVAGTTGPFRPSVAIAATTDALPTYPRWTVVNVRPSALPGVASTTPLVAMTLRAARAAALLRLVGASPDHLSAGESLMCPVEVALRPDGEAESVAYTLRLTPDLSQRTPWREQSAWRRSRGFSFPWLVGNGEPGPTTVAEERDQHLACLRDQQHVTALEDLLSRSNVIFVGIGTPDPLAHRLLE